MSTGRIVSLVATVLAATCFLAGCGKDDPKDPTVPETPPAGWEKQYRIHHWSYGTSVKQTTDGGYIVTGWTQITGDTGRMVMLLKTDAEGNLLWQIEFPALSLASGVSVLEAADGGYLVLADYHGNSREFWIIKTDSRGQMLWNQFRGYGDRNESAQQARPAADGGYLLFGSTDRGGADWDYWVVKIGPNGESRWHTEKGYDGCNEFASSLEQTADGGYLLVGTTDCSGDRIWLVKLFADLSNHWLRTVNTGVAAYGRASCRTVDNAHVIMGEVGEGDQRLVCLFKYDEAGNELWRTIHPGPGYFWRGQVQQTSDGGFMVATTKQPNATTGGDFCLITFDETGNTLWEKTFGSGICEAGEQTADGGYILCGNNGPYVYLVKTDQDGNTE
jgi:hypothetical protein